MTITGKHLITGEWEHVGHLTFTSVDPRQKVASPVLFYNATPEEIDRAAVAAAKAFQVMRTYPATRLAEFLDRVAAEIEALGDALIETADRETALGIPRLTSERARTTGQLRAFGALLREGSYVEAIIDTAQPDRQPAPRPDMRRMLFPIGPVAVFSASNFPFAFSVAGGDTASALAAGCPVIVKAHPGHPATSELTAQAVKKAMDACDFPAGCFSMVQGDRIEVGQKLVEHPLIEAVGFTGSLRAGRAIFDTAARRAKPIPVYAEMSSVNPVVILPGAIHKRGEALAEQVAASVTLGCGQFCTNPGLVFVVDGPETLAFMKQVSERMDQRDAGVLLNANIERGLVQAVQETLTREGVRQLTAARPDEGTEGYSYPNTVLQMSGETFRMDAGLQNEHFGPVTAFVVCDNQDDMELALDFLRGNLTATIQAEADEMDAARRLYDRLREKVGRLIWNGFPTGVEVVYAMQHGGPYPATTAPATTSVGMMAIKRFMRPVAFQNMPGELLPDALKDGNPLKLWRIVDNQWTRG